MIFLSKTLPYKHYPQSEAYCGPASLRILLSYFDKNYSEDELARLCRTTREEGTEHQGMIDGARAVGGFVFAKENGKINEIEYFVTKKKLPLIVGWFDRDGDHFSVVVGTTKKHLIFADPGWNSKRRYIEKELFTKTPLSNGVWFDFVGLDSKIVSWGWYMVVTFDKQKFDLPGGTYYEPKLNKK